MTSGGLTTALVQTRNGGDGASRLGDGLVQGVQERNEAGFLDYRFEEWKECRTTEEMKETRRWNVWVWEETVKFSLEYIV